MQQVHAMAWLFALITYIGIPETSIQKISKKWFHADLLFRDKELQSAIFIFYE
ncbi:MAG: hypothetical protein LBN95_07355 [Prevotellaceae bacterium]|jgi:hypothetical protein|nr:hypothetical protein [Prevotellaceae bacterium]